MNLPLKENSSDFFSRIRGGVEASLASFMSKQDSYLATLGPELHPVAAALNSFLLDGGKRFRPLFAYIGYLGSGAKENSQTLTASASLELLHACALIHDDLMDGSDTRRGAPAIHKRFERIHRDQKFIGSAEKFGASSAILLGDLALIWSDQMLHSSGVAEKALLRSLPVHNEMRVELMVGQYLDVLEGALATKSVERSLKVARYKSGKYSVERPLHFGAALGEENKDSKKVRAIYSDYGLPLGESFQLRDDILGVFGDPQETGKPAGDDLREGKRTVLMAMTYASASTSQIALIDSLFGKSDISPEKISAIQEIIQSSGALAQCEKLISTLYEEAVRALNDEVITDQIKNLLTDLAGIATQRSF